MRVVLVERLLRVPAKQLAPSAMSTSTDPGSSLRTVMLLAPTPNSSTSHATRRHKPQARAIVFMRSG